MIKLVKTISTELGNGGRRLIKILGMGRGDVQTPYQASPFGIDSNPVKDMVAVQANTGEMGKTAIIGYINVKQLAELGEIRLYATEEDGTEQPDIYIHLKNDDTMEIGGNSDFMVRYSALETAFNQLKQDFNTHVHPSNGAPPTTPSAADITPAKIEKVKTL